MKIAHQDTYTLVAMSDNSDDAQGLVQCYKRRFGGTAKVVGHYRVHVLLPIDDAMRDFALAYIAGFCDGRADTMQETHEISK